MAEFGQILKETIERKGLTQKWVAEHSGTTEATISRYTTSVHKPSVIEIAKNIAKCLNVSVDYLVGASNCETPSPTYPDDVFLLMQAYDKATVSDRAVIWALLDKYMSPIEKKRLDEFNRKQAEEAGSAHR